MRLPHFLGMSDVVALILKWGHVRADITSMIISEEQVRRAAEYLHTHNPERHVTISVPADQETAAILARVVDVLRAMPDLRDDRVAEARLLLTGSMPPPKAVADKLIGRVISDSIR